MISGESFTNSPLKSQRRVHGGAGVLLRENTMLTNHSLIAWVARRLNLADNAVNKPAAPVGHKDRRQRSTVIAAVQERFAKVGGRFSDPGRESPSVNKTGNSRKRAKQTLGGRMKIRLG